jgi:prepilin-type N-terminal cleavage/methylation domain-containing protein
MLSADRLRPLPRSGLTLVELLVVVAIIGLIVALLLPAVQAARESARRTQCQSNLRQLGLALTHYTSSNGTFPPGNVGKMGFNWLAMILPFIEQQKTYDDLDWWDHERLFYTTSPVGDNVRPLGYDVKGSARNQAAHQNFRSATVRCPSDPMPLILTGNYSAKGHLTPSYAGVAGSSDAILRTVTVNTDRCPGTALVSHCFNGILPARREVLEIAFDGVSPAAVRDGLSNVIMLGEQTSWGWATNSTGETKQNECKSAGRFGWAVGGYHSPTPAFPNQSTPTREGRHYNITIVSRPLGTLFCERPGADTGTHKDETVSADNTCAFRSAHGAGAVFAFGDGSVRWLSDDIDFRLYRLLAIRDSGQPKVLP